MKLPLRFWYILAIILCIPAFLINLDLITLNEDEAIRALVALEMRLSGDFITPTLNDTLYYAKPPLYNWLLNISFYLTGQINEFSLRLPTILFLGLFAGSIYYYSKKYYNSEYAFVNAFLFLTCGRVLFWDSMLGYIDICYSWITFMNLMVIFHCHQKEKFRSLFLLSFFLAAIGFMLKGLPTLLFQSLSLLVFFAYKKDLKRLLSKEFFYGISIFILIVGTYYSYYFYSNPNNSAIDGLVDQSTRRTLIHDKHDLWDFIVHIFTYPFENMYHFLPWSIMFIYIIRRDLFKIIYANEFLKYCFVIFMANIIVYWVSIEVYPRYILMLIPLQLSIFLYFHKINYEKESKLYKLFTYFSLALILFGAGLNFYFIFWEQLNDINYPIQKSLLTAIPLILIAIYFYYNKPQRILVFICALLIMRISFNLFVIPDRYQNDLATDYKKQAITIGEKYRNEDFRIFEGSKIDYTSSFYISNTRNKITPRDYKHESNSAFFVIDTTRYDIPEDFVKVDEFQIREANKILTIIKKNN